MQHKYSVILCTLSASGGNVWENPVEVLEAVANAGYNGVDLDAEPDRIDSKKFNEVKELAFSLGLKVPALIGAWAPWHAGEVRDLASSDESERRHGIDYAKKSIDLAATFDDPPCFEIVASPAESEYPVTKTPIKVLRDNFIKSTVEITEYAAEHNVNIGIEPINRFEGYAGFLNSLVEAKDIADEINADNLGVLADFFHVNMEDGPINDALRSVSDRLMHIHLADNNRQGPGTGHIDFLQIIRTLNSIKFNGYISLDSVPAKPDWKTVLNSTIIFMKQMEKMADLQEQIVHPV